MNGVDLFLAVVMVIAIIAGYYKGFLMASLDLLMWIGSLVMGYIFYPYTARFISIFMNAGIWLLPIAFILTTMIARLILGMIARVIVHAIPAEANDNFLNRIMGIIPGAINGLIYTIIFSAMLLSLPLKDSVTTETRNSRFAGRLAMQSEWANQKLTPVFGEAVHKTITSLTVNPDSNKEVQLSFKYNNATEMPGLEAKMLAMVNKERTSRGLKPVVADPQLTLVGRAHSKDMFARGYFAHETPEGIDPFERMKKANVVFLAAGENLALAPTLEIAHTNLMNSPGHKANILNPNFGRLGIGILDGGYYGLMISQEFRD